MKTEVTTKIRHTLSGEELLKIFNEQKIVPIPGASYSCKLIPFEDGGTAGLIVEFESTTETA